MLDAFCGCGTTVAVANRLKRRWVGMDITYQSVALILKRLKDSEGQAAVDAVELHGVPKDMESVDALIHKKDDRVRKEFEKRVIQSSKMTNNTAWRESLGQMQFRLHSFKLTNKIMIKLFVAFSNG